MSRLTLWTLCGGIIGIARRKLEITGRKRLEIHFGQTIREIMV